MAMHHAAPGEVVDLASWADDLPGEKTKAIVKTDTLELARLVLPGGHELRRHSVAGPVVLHCLEGRIAVGLGAVVKELESNQLLHLAPGEPHSIAALDDAVLLLTVVFP